ncbi:MAG: NRDE family protein [Candidatus Sericytochromatia bacterium]|nr:NRDE family protein [Candidatus Sericytochromatia bacterium]
MSVIALAWKHYAHYPLILLSNRDEFRSRPTEKLMRWDTDPVIYAGRDPQSGGTWLGMTETGKFAALTDFHWHQATDIPHAQSRGRLLLAYLLGDLDPASFLSQTQSQRKKSLPFNLLVGDRERLFYCCSVSNLEEELSPGIHSLSDYFMDSAMPKCRYLKKNLEKRMIDDNLTAQERVELFEILGRTLRFPQEELPKRGYPPAVEHERSPIFLDLGDYGTVSSSLLTVDNEGQVIFDERSYQSGEAHTTHSLHFQLHSPEL